MTILKRFLRWVTVVWRCPPFTRYILLLPTDDIVVILRPWGFSCTSVEVFCWSGFSWRFKFTATPLNNKEFSFPICRRSFDTLGDVSGDEFVTLSKKLLRRLQNDML